MSGIIPLSDITLTARTPITTDWKCRRKRWWSHHWGGRGLSSDTLAVELFIGSAVHDGIAAIATSHLTEDSVDIDLIASTASKMVLDTLSDGTEDLFAREQATLVEGLLRGFYRLVWPQLIRQYLKIVAIEQEMVYSISPTLWFMARPDLVMEDTDGELHMLEWKTTSSKREEWINQWGTAAQVHSYIKAIEQTLGRAPIDVTVIGMYKGWLQYGKLSSPLVYGFRRAGNPPFSQDEISYKYRAGFSRVPVWELRTGVKGWVDGMPLEVLSEQFPQTPPLFIKDEMVDAFFRQTSFREAEIKLAIDMMEQADEESRQGILDVSFAQSFQECNPGYGRGCEFRKLCFGQVDNPLNTGYSLRTFNHKLEDEQHVEREAEREAQVPEGQVEGTPAGREGSPQGGSPDREAGDSTLPRGSG